MREPARETQANWRKRRALTALGLLGLMLVSTQQNCAPASGGSRMQASSADEAPMPVGEIDSVTATAGLAFTYNKVEVEPLADQVSIKGVCSESQEGAVLGWTVNEVADDGAKGAEFARGQSVCSGGEFGVELSPTQELTCGQDYKITARLGFGKPGEVVINRPCAGGE